MRWRCSLFGTMALLVLAHVSTVDGGVTGFSWTASLNRSTGIATSHEVSRLPASCPLHRALESKNNRQVAAVAKDLFSDYPSWLANRGFKLVRAVPMQKDTAIQDPLFGVTFLIFGTGRLSLRRAKGRVEHKFVLPIVGGLLARPSPKSTFGGLSFSLIQQGSRQFALDTSICDGYQPAIAGAPPVNRVRAGVYRCTQSLLHAFVMWRFHRHCYASVPKS